MKHRTLLAALASYLLANPLPTFAAPPLINYQGRIVVGTTNFDGMGQFKFALVDGGVNLHTQATASVPPLGGSITFIGVTSGGSGYVTAPAVTITDSTGTGATAVAILTGGAVTSFEITSGGSGYSFQPTVTIAPPPPNISYTYYWRNSGPGPIAGEPPDAVVLPVAKGLYSVLLGDTIIPNMAAFPGGLSSIPDLRLRVWFSNDGNNFQLLSPDQRLAPVAYVADGAVTSTTIADAAITSVKVAAGAITGTQLASGTIDATRLSTPGNPSAGQVLGYNAGSLAWIAGGPFSLNGTNAFYNGGKVGIGTSTPAGALQLANGGLAITGASSPFTGVGQGLFLERNGAAGGVFAFNYTNSTPLPLLLNFPGGNVGIGTDAPVHRLSIAGGPNWTGNGWKGAIALSSGAAIGWGENSFGNSFGVGQSFGGFYIFHTESAPGTVSNSAIYDFFINDVGDVGIGTINPVEKLDVNGTIRTKVLKIVGGADIAEPFPMKEDELAKGSVVVIDAEHPGRLKRSTGAYDTRVAGIISGANGVNPGIALHQEGVMEGGQNVALSGRVYVRADATGAPIKPGDLLTTSGTPGHAMKVTEPSRAQGAVIGKAMSSLDSGTGMVLVLVTLQ